MKKLLFILIIILCVVFFIKNRNSSDESSDSGLTVSDIEGVWVQELVDGTETMEFHDDMTYTNNITLISTIASVTTNSTSTDKYELDGNKIRIHYTKFGKISEYDVTITNDTMIWKINDQEIIYTRQ